MELFCSGAAVRPPAGIVGQFEQRLAALGGIERWLLLMCPLRAAASARDVDISRILSRRRRAPFFLRDLSRARTGETQAKNFAEDRGARDTAETNGDGRGRFALGPQLSEQTDTLRRPWLFLHERSPLAFATVVVVCALPVVPESVAIVPVLGT
jgi:hypothetical protein